MRPEASNRIDHRHDRLDIDFGTCAAAVAKKGEPGLQLRVVKDAREQHPPIIAGAVLTRYRDEALSRIDEVCERNQLRLRASRTVAVNICCREAIPHCGN